ncbi:MAG TPA: hypothetical protein VGG06_16320 [Thermoanaerobaculia bacterium]|jgi:hypothetical protein
MSDPGAPQMVTVKCEKHGLRYNPNLHSGCVRCRREAGEPISGSGALAPGPVAEGPANAGGSVVPALAVAALLVIVTGGGFYAAHRQWHERYGNLLGGGQETYGEDYYDAEELEFPDELELTPEEREQLEGLRDELEKRIREESGQ